VVSFLVGLIVIGIGFAACTWGGRMLSRHYNDGWEVVAALVVAVSVLTPVALWDGAAVPLLAGVCALGVFAGYERPA
jgi:low affinity Fe/Cu permease